MSARRLTLSHDRKIAGVCGGLAQYFGLDATVVRVSYLLLTLFTTGFPGIMIYFLLWFVMPRS